MSIETAGAMVFSREMRRRASSAERRGHGFRPPEPGRPQGGRGCCLLLLIAIVVIVVLAFIDAYVLTPPPPRKKKSDVRPGTAAVCYIPKSTLDSNEICAAGLFTGKNRIRPTTWSDTCQNMAELCLPAKNLS